MIEGHGKGLEAVEDVAAEVVDDAFAEDLGEAVAVIPDVLGEEDEGEIGDDHEVEVVEFQADDGVGADAGDDDGDRVGEKRELNGAKGGGEDEPR